MSSFRRSGFIRWDLVATPVDALLESLKRQVYIGIMAICAIVQAVFGEA